MTYIVLFFIGVVLALLTSASFVGSAKLGSLSFAFVVVAFEILVTTWLVNVLGYEIRLAECAAITCGYVPFCFLCFHYKGNKALRNIL